MNDQEKGAGKELVYVRPLSDYPCREDDEISLVDLWLVMARRKWIIFGITALVLAIGLGYALIKPVVYEYRTGIELAMVHGGPESKGLELLSPKEGSVILLRDVIVPSKRKELFGAGNNGPKVEVIEKSTIYSLILKTEAEPEKLDAVTKFHKAVVESLARQHATDYDKRLDIIAKPFQARAAMLQDQILTLERELQRLYEISNGEKTVSSLVNAQQMGDIRKEMAETRVQLTDAKSAVEMIRNASHPTRVSFLAAESDEPAGPGKKLIIGLSLLLGLMSGVFASFFREFLANAKSATKEKISQMKSYE